MMPSRASPLFFNLPFLPQNGADGETRTLVGQCARQFTKLLLSLLSHIGEMVGMKGIAPPRLPDSESGPSAIRV